MRNIYENLFEMRSNKLISDFDYIPDNISKKQEKICEDCRYRWYRIDLDIIKFTMRGYLRRNYPPEPECKLEKCLIDNTNLLNIRRLNKSKGGEK